MEQLAKGAEKSAPDFVLRDLKATDVWQLVRILSKIRVKDFAKAVDPEVAAAAKWEEPTMYNEEGEIVPLPRDRWTEAQIDAEMRAEMAEKEIEWALLDIVMNNIGGCEHDVNRLLAMGTGSTEEEIRNLDANDYMQLLFTYVSREGFRDFFMQAWKLLQGASSLKNPSGGVIRPLM